MNIIISHFLDQIYILFKNSASLYTNEIKKIMQLPSWKFNYKSKLYPNYEEYCTSEIFLNEILNLFPKNKYYYDDKIINKINYSNKEKLILKNKISNELFNKLRDYQQKDAEMMLNKERIINANDVGLGKSLEALATAEALQNEYTKCIIICPASIKFSAWAEEIKKHLNKSYTVINGTEKSRLKKYDENNYYLIVNYDLIWRDKDIQKLKKIVETNKCILIADEAHYLKNITSNRTKSFNLLANRSDRLILITGTPLMNSPEELYSLFKLINSGIFYNKQLFLENFCNIDFWGKVSSIKKEKKEQLKQIIATHSFRRKIQDTLDMPEITFQTREVELTTEQKKMYKEAKEELKVLLSNDTEINIINALTKIQRLKQIATGCFTIDKDNLSSNKITELEKILEEITQNENKVVIFSFYRSTVEILREKLKKYNPAFTIGGMTADQKYDQMKKFQDNENCKAMIITASGAEGITLTAGNYFIFVDKMWNPAKNRQLYGRIWRFGQQKRCVVISLISKNTVDSYIEKVLKDKQQMFDEIIEGIDGGILNNREQFLKLSKEVINFKEEE